MGKRKQNKKSKTAPLARNLNKKEELPNLWCLPDGTNFNSLFGDHAEGNAIVAKILELKFCHHIQNQRISQQKVVPRSTESKLSERLQFYR